jgi:hypothetical protein
VSTLHRGVGHVRDVWKSGSLTENQIWKLKPPHTESCSDGRDSNGGGIVVFSDIAVFFLLFNQFLLSFEHAFIIF